MVHASEANRRRIGRGGGSSVHPAPTGFPTSRFVELIMAPRPVQHWTDSKDPAASSPPLSDTFFRIAGVDSPCSPASASTTSTWTAKDLVRRRTSKAVDGNQLTDSSILQKASQSTSVCIERLPSSGRYGAFESWCDDIGDAASNSAQRTKLHQLGVGVSSWKQAPTGLEGWRRDQQRQSQDVSDMHEARYRLCQKYRAHTVWIESMKTQSPQDRQMQWSNHSCKYREWKRRANESDAKPEFADSVWHSPQNRRPFSA